MNFQGIDADDQDLVAESDYAAARTYANYELRGRASQDERTWLAEHPVHWLTALKAIRSETWRHIERESVNIKTHPAKPGPYASPEQQAEWLPIKTEHQRQHARRRHVVALTTERINIARGLISSANLNPWRVNLIVSTLLDIETLLTNEDNERAREKIRWLTLKIADENGLGDA